MKVFLVRLLFAAALFNLFGMNSARADGQIAYVTVFGTGDCSSPSTACGDLYQAASYAGDNGEVVCLSNGFFGSGGFTVGVTINCPNGVVQGLNINAPNKNVRIIGLRIDNKTCPTCTALRIRAAASVTLENIVVTNSLASAPAINDQRTGPGKLVIKNSLVVDNAGVGIVIVPQGGTNLSVSLDNVTSSNNTYGLAVGSGGLVRVGNSTFSGNGIAGIEADVGAQISVNNSAISHNNVGVQAYGAVRLSNNDIVFNGTVSNGAPGSFGNNRLSGNTNGNTGLTPLGNASTDVAQQ